MSLFFPSICSDSLFFMFRFIKFSIIKASLIAFSTLFSILTSLYSFITFEAISIVFILQNLHTLSTYLC
ncbi:unnamed protein product [Meloidogyne enterolobii]|uniref:Uncharacterized protein n=1 Tax=Meloidogyne enterolobii TaxID=390850 RepID=A0ACB1AI62_MELEN